MSWRGIVLHPVSEWLARLVLGGLFLVAAVYKIADPEGFVGAIQAYRFLPRVLTHLPAIIIPWLELLCALAVLTGVWRKAALSWLGSMLSFFILLFIYVMVRHIDINCGCFGEMGESLPVWLRQFVDPTSVGVTSIFRNLMLIAFCAIAWFAPEYRCSLQA